MSAEVLTHTIQVAAGLGIKTDFPEIEALAPVLARVREMHEDGNRVRAMTPDELIESAVASYAAGKITAEELLTASTSAYDEDGRRRITDLITRAQAIIEGAASVKVRKLDAEWILAARGPVTAVAADLERCAKAFSGPFDADPEGLRSLAQANLQRAVDRWEELIEVVGTLTGRGRSLNLWLREDRYDGPPWERGASLVASMCRAGCKPGIWTKAEVVAARPKPAPPVAQDTAE